MAKSEPPQRGLVMVLCGAIIVYILYCGLLAGNLPVGAGWRFFSWHPFLMVASIGLATISALVKKLGGYTNTQLHGLLSFLAVSSMFAGYYVIWANKEAMNKPHIKTNHAYSGVGVMLSYTGLMAVGAVGLHPDYGFLKTNKTVRFLHKSSGRLANLAAMATAGLKAAEMAGVNTGVKVSIVAPLAVMGAILFM